MTKFWQNIVSAGFMTDANRLNVALSRVKKAMIIIGKLRDWNNNGFVKMQHSVGKRARFLIDLLRDVTARGLGEHVQKQILVFAHVDNLIADIKGAQRSLEALFDSLEQQLNVESSSSHGDVDSSGDMENISEWPMDEVNSIPTSDTVRNVFPAADTIATWASQSTRHINVYSIGQW
ncbi:hypothetical protein BDV24DRAFT_165029 [Aspergillus arachidicola]|uniref:DNA2/NAM7 helicase-like C-terminal domain-containing protein n=1 Tax=Aspergillus arachidicola TaxID=656916 RepID=A0A2G7G8I0_9EURO|nr:hypothetical protein BDV24DRAFT_165029 [Aspergillus arachidicola]PIG89146.1 hypothetical protein AARAC_002417 [Aspergillus arachidicola]